ncbi:OmpA/MotB domain-containing protein [Marinobacter santoriniensis NKSG1]|jgi:outer membrane protein OmpA-like peptidoglycan-associated protein|uniref:OmpA/MotB domain-containing protein n=1 Tax=Marinobacter santoriniensis NKSG1 TaxID=1288826 RepID=M7CX44_9GAMM|nr:OmpA/MotB domain-containing protein [Marinobacter santoriniensis NKSG1]
MVAAFAISAVAPASHGASFGAGVETSQWYLSESVFQCSLVHDVPGYGRAVFRRRAGESLSFFLETDSALMKPGRGHLVVEAPAWRPGVAPKPLGSINISDGNRPVALDTRKALMVARGLLDGMQPTIIRDAWYDGNPVRVQVSNINFAGPFEQYRACTANLLPVNFDQIQRSKIRFSSGSKSLSKSEMKLLDNIATFVRADSTIEHIFVDGHTDRRGSRIDNRALSEDRANVVADYLKFRGVPEDLIIVRAHGDRYPISNRPSENRRTTIRLQRKGERPVFQQASGYGGDDNAG